MREKTQFVFYFYDSMTRSWFWSPARWTFVKTSLTFPQHLNWDVMRVVRWLIAEQASGSSSLRDSGTSLHPPCSTSPSPRQSQLTPQPEELIMEIKRLRDRWARQRITIGCHLIIFQCLDCVFLSQKTWDCQPRLTALTGRLISD